MYLFISLICITIFFLYFVNKIYRIDFKKRKFVSIKKVTLWDSYFMKAIKDNDISLIKKKLP